MFGVGIKKEFTYLHLRNVDLRMLEKGSSHQTQQRVQLDRLLASYRKEDHARNPHDPAELAAFGPSLPSVHEKLLSTQIWFILVSLDL